MRFKVLLGLLLWVAPLMATHAEGDDEPKATLSGFVKDESNGEALVGATVHIVELSKTTITNMYGFYSISVTPGDYTVIYSYLGFAPQSKKVSLKSTMKMNIELGTDSKQLEEVVVTGEKINQNVTAVANVQKMEMKEMKKIPAFMGEVDVIRNITLLPGVTTVGEGASGFNVRGGSIDHNLILLDDAPLYSSSHLFGFFSVFNPDAVSEVELKKGGISSQYGGRLASVLDVRMKEGNAKKFEANGSISSVSSKLSLEAPIIKDKASFFISGRRSYADLFLLASPEEDLRNTKAYFYDLTSKVNYRISDKDRIFVSAYIGRDVFKISDRFKMNWGNATVSSRWNHVFNPKLFANLTAYYSDYSYNLGVPDGANGFDWTSHIFNQSVKPDFTFYINSKSTLDFGANFINYRFQPGNVHGLGDESIFNAIKIAERYANEYAAYVSHKQEIGNRLTLQYGLRYSAFDYRGKTDTTFDYIDNPNDYRHIGINPRVIHGESVKTYHNLEPRASVKFALNENSSIKANYQRTAQYIHLFSNSTAAFPIDLWHPSSNNLKPQLADQVALGYFKNFKNDMFESSVEVYYKDMQNQIDFIPGALLLINEKIEAELLSGIGRSYGAEFYLKKRKGKFTGWASYTLSRSERKIEGINRGNWYASNFDSPHNFVLVGMYELNDRWSLGSTFTLISGRPATFPNSRFEYQGYIVPHNTNDSRNNYRLPTYHRLDLSATWKHKTTSKFSSEFVFSVYNLYGRRNAFSTYTRQQTEEVNGWQYANLNTEAVRISIIAYPIPSVTWNFKF